MTLILDETAVITQATTDKAGDVAIPNSPLDANGVPKKFPKFDKDLWALLEEIRGAGVSLKGFVAQYAGFYLTKINGAGETAWDENTNNANNPDVDPQSIATATSQPNKSLDKLTFMIMFRLPFSKRTNPGFEYYGKPDDASVKYGDPSHPVQSWTYRGNQLRTDPLRKLNEAGEQLNGNQRCNDSKTPIDDLPNGELNTPAAYQYYNNVAADKTGALETAIKKQPVYLYLTIVTEASFTDPQTLQLVQFPEDIVGQTGGKQNLSPPPTLRRREVKFGMYQLSFGFEVFTPSASIPSFPPYSLDQRYIKKDPNGPHPNECYVHLPGPLTLPPGDRVYVQLKYDAEKVEPNGKYAIWDTVFELEGLQIQKAPNQDVYYAAYTAPGHSVVPFTNLGFRGPGDVQLDNVAISARSGVTMAWGFDIGQGAREGYQYYIQFTIWKYAGFATQLPAGPAEFNLRYKDRFVRIAFNVPAQASTGLWIKTALLTLLQLKEKPWPEPAPQTITVTPVNNPSDPDYPTGWTVKIIRANMDPGEDRAARDQGLFADSSGFYNIYSASIFYQKDAVREPVHANIKITPDLEEDRYRINTSASAAWTGLMDQLDEFCGGPWRTVALSGATAKEIKEFETLLRGSLNIRRGNFYQTVINRFSLMKKFKLPSVAILFPPFVRRFMIPKYYTPALSALPDDLKMRTNAAEKYVLMTLVYRAYVSGIKADVLDAIRTKDFAKLIKVVETNNDNEKRKKVILENLNKHFKKHLYRNIGA